MNAYYNLMVISSVFTVSQTQLSLPTLCFCQLWLKYAEIQGSCPHTPKLSHQGGQGNAALPLNFSSRCFPIYQHAVSKLGNWVRLTIFNRLSTSYALQDKATGAWAWQSTSVAQKGQGHFAACPLLVLLPPRLGSGQKQNMTALVRHWETDVWWVYCIICPESVKSCLYCLTLGKEPSWAGGGWSSSQWQVPGGNSRQFGTVLPSGCGHIHPGTSGIPPCIANRCKESSGQLSMREHGQRGQRWVHHPTLPKSYTNITVSDSLLLLY